MQNSTSPTLATYLSGLAALASLVGIPVSSILTYFFTRPKQSAEIHKAEAEIEEIKSSIMMKIYGRLDDYETMRQRDGDTIADLENRNFNLEWAGREKDSEKKRMADEIEILHMQIQKARAQGFLAEDREPHSPNPAA
jgi:hypothetical protein